MTTTFPFAKTLFLSTITLLLAAGGCKKDKDKDPPAITCQLQSIQNTGNDTAAIAYDAQGKVDSFGSLAYALYAFTYSGLTASSTVSNTSTSIPHMNIFLDAQRRVESMNRTYVSGPDTYYYNYSFTYDGEGHIIICEQGYHESGSLNYNYTRDSMVYANGNLVSKYVFGRVDANPYVLSSHLEMTYTAQENKIGYHAFGLWEEPISQLSGWQAYYHLFGKASKNLPAITRYYDNTGTELFNVDYTFLLNENGYPTDENMIRTGSFPGARNRRFFYTCH